MTRARVVLFLELCCGLILRPVCGGSASSASITNSATAVDLVSNTADLRRLGSGPQAVSCAFALEGTVLWVSADCGEFMLQDKSGGIRVECDIREAAGLQRGDRIRVSGRAIAGADGLSRTLIDNDGRHGPIELERSVYLPAGRLPIRVDYFNGLAGFDLNLDYQGPNIPRQKIPDKTFRTRDEEGSTMGKWNFGLKYSSYDGNWSLLPDFSQLTPAKSGIVSNLDLSIRSRDQFFGVQFSGFLEVPCAGTFTFWLRSDDGGRLFLGGTPLTITKTGVGAMPPARPLAIGAPVTRQDQFCWSEAEGVLLSIQPEPGGGMEAVLGAGTNRMRMDVADSSGSAPPLFSKVRVKGICLSAAGQNDLALAGRLLTPSWHDFKSVAQPLVTGTKPPDVTIGQLRALAAGGQRSPGAVRLRGNVLAADNDAGVVSLADDSGVAMLELDVRDCNLQPGQRIAVSGSCVIDRSWVRFRPQPLVDNDGIHNLTERSAATFLTAGKHPLRLCWFNYESAAGLEVYWEGPGHSRERIPEAALVHTELGSDGETIEWVPGLTFQTYEGRWSQVPASLRLAPASQGVNRQFDPSVATRGQQTAIEFSGCLEVPRDGVYTFSTVSDDGCLLFVDAFPTYVEVLGHGPVLAPTAVAPRQILSGEQPYRWVQSEGRVTFATKRGGTLILELNAGTGRMQVEVAGAQAAATQLLLNSVVKVTGICQADFTADGQRVAGTLVVPSEKELQYLEMAPTHWADYPVIAIGRLPEATVRSDYETVVHVRGKVVAQAEDGALVVEDESGQAQLYTTQSPPDNDALEVEALARLCREGTNSVLRCAFFREATPQTDQPSAAVPVLTTIEQVKRLSRREAQRSYPVKIRGVVTSPLTAGCFMQDGAWAIYVRWPNTIKGEFPRAGEYWEIEGITFAEFAPNIRARGAVKLGTAVMPEPFRPTWDQLINGSLDTRYVEIQGVVTGVESDGLVLLTRDGRIKVQLVELPPQTLRLYQDAVIRLRGCLVPEKDPNAHKVELGRIGLSNCSVTVDEAAPGDPFALPLKRIGELLLFDPRASSIQRVKLSGQILDERHGEFFLNENDAGLRFFLRAPGELRRGDLVEVVGFPDLSGPSPVLHEAVARRIGHAALPAPVVLAVTNLLSRRFDSARVRIEAQLANCSFNQSDQVLELQAGGRGFIGRLDQKRGRLGALSPGTRLALTGVYAGQGGDIASGRDIDSFELLLGSLGDVRVLQRPSWWTGQHALMVLSAMSIIIIIALLWITQLRHQVEERSQLLAAEVRSHEQTERQRALEQERARISRDLHDDLGATLTQIRLLSALESRDATVPPGTRSRMNQVTEKSREMVASLDEIVWAVNPANDSLPSLATYLCQFSEEFLRSTPIRCRLDVADPLPDVPLTSEVRHNVYLAVREALNNIAKHSQASEVWLRIHSHDHTLRIALEDNGRGFSFPAESLAGDGLSNMRNRLERIGGHFECQTRTGAGTICRIWVPVKADTA